MTQFYIGCKQVEAWEQEKDGKPGYAVKYPDGYLSWSPKETFEAAYLPMGIILAQGICFGIDATTGRNLGGKDHPNADRVTQQMVDGFIRHVEYCKHGEKTTVGCATLANGFEIVESSSCVEAANYDDDLGRRLVLRRIQDRVWMLLGFLLQAARNGVK